MGEDEAATVRDLKDHQAVVLPLVSRLDGRIIDTAGDGILAEFPSVVRALECAVEIQKLMTERNEGVPEKRRMRFRIGVNLGDVIYDETRIYGDGINIAARLEGIADPGEIYVTRAVKEQVGDRLPYAFEAVGLRELKNISQPIDVWRVMWGGARGTVAMRPAKRDARPSLAVLPFANLDGDPAQDYFAEGLTEDITTDISRFSRMSVVAASTVLASRERAVEAARVGRELGVSYVLEGSVRKSGDRVRLSARLVDAATGHHLWAQRYDREMKDLFDVQDEMTRAIVSELEIQILEGEQALSWQRGTTNPVALDHFRQSRAAVVPLTLTGFLDALRHLERAVELDPSYARACAGVASLGMGAIMHGLKSEQERVLGASRFAAEEALRLDPKLAEGWIAKGQYLVFDGRRGEAQEAARRGLALSPNANIVMSGAARIYLFSGRVDSAIGIAREVVGKKPGVTRHPALIIGMGSIVLGRYGDALPLVEALLAAAPQNPVARLILAAAYSGLGRTADAAEEGGQFKRLIHGEPFGPLAKWMLPFIDPEPRERFVGLMRNAGIE